MKKILVFFIITILLATPRWVLATASFGLVFDAPHVTVPNGGFQSW
jgi:hypothetical protein